MLSFESDYTQGAHEKILQRLIETNYEPLSGYGNDRYCGQAKEKIRRACGSPNADVFFLVGGTQTNLIVIDALLRQYEGVVSADTGHVGCHEAGAIERTGHKVLTIPGHQGKIEASELDAYLQGFWKDENHEHMVFPGMVYLSHPTEYGTLYSSRELSEISAVCKRYGIPLYLDGARLGYGLAAKGTDVTLPLLSKLCDVFYIGGTKVGALCGEAVVFPGGNMPPHFLTIAKQHGGLLAKGRLLGIQFDALFTDELYLEISSHAIRMAELLKECFHRKGYPFYLESPTNQQFLILENARMEELKKQAAFGYWERLDREHTVVRFATSWATRQEDIEALSGLL